MHMSLSKRFSNFAHASLCFVLLKFCSSKYTCTLIFKLKLFKMSEETFAERNKPDFPEGATENNFTKGGF